MVNVVPGATRRPGTHTAQRTCIVTGAGSGIGAAVARRLRDAGHLVGLIDRAADNLAKVAADFSPDTATEVVADVADEADVARAVETVARSLGEPTVLVTCAAVSGAVPSLRELSKETWDATFAVNVGGAMLFAREMVPYFERAGGAIVTMASIAAFTSGPGRLVYSASKGAVVALTKALAVELGPYGVRANVICPASVDTPFSRTATEARGAGSYERGLAATAALYPVGHVASADEIAAVAQFLCSEDASFLSGAVVMADGGLMSKMPLLQPSMAG